MGAIDHIDIRLGPAHVLADPLEPPSVGWIEVVGGRIHHVGPTPSALEAAETIDVTGRLIIPALVNTHCHLSQQLGRGLADDVDLLTWLHERIWPYELALTESDVELSATLCAVEQIRNGTTTVADPGGRHVDAAARGVLSAGIRAVLGRSSMDTGDGRPPTDQEDTETVLSIQDELFDRWHGVEGLLVSYTLRTIFNCSDQLILRTVSRAIERGAVVQMHVAEIPEENEFSLATRGATTIAHLRSLGVLGPHFLGAHATWASDEEIEILAATNTSLSHNAGSNLKILGVPRVAEWLEAGINVAIGTDGAPSNNRMSVIDEMWLASLTQKGRRNDPTALPAPVMLAMATVNGAKALGLGDLLGRLAPGFAADLVIIDPRTTNFVPVHDPHAGLVNSLKTENVESVMSAGRWLMRGREVLTIDEEALIDEARDRARHIRRRLGLPDSGF